MMNYEQRLKEIERKEQELLQQKRDLEEKRRVEEERLSRLDQIVEQSGMAPKDLVEGLVARFNLSFPRPSRKKAKSAEGGRTRTTVTAELRDKIKHDLSQGRSKSDIQREYGVSYPVVQKVRQGKYDSLG